MSSSPARGTTLKPMPGTYTAVEVSAPGELRVVERNNSARRERWRWPRDLATQALVSLQLPS
jgi:hypothetical protein